VLSRQGFPVPWFKFFAISRRQAVKGRLKTSHLWAPQNQPVFRCV